MCKEKTTRCRRPQWVNVQGGTERRRTKYTQREEILDGTEDTSKTRNMVKETVVDTARNNHSETTQQLLG